MRSGSSYWFCTTTQRSSSVRSRTDSVSVAVFTRTTVADSGTEKRYVKIGE